ncbi:MAG TPA: hypothetical protein VMU87_14570 [Stellaceae bacterium]|nr:hypothetical protein [Stellaceae bacterium]
MARLVHPRIIEGSLESTPETIIPFFYANAMERGTCGMEAWGACWINAWWRLNAGLNLLRKDLRFRRGSSGLAGISSAGDDPTHQESLRSSMDVMPAVSFDAELREVGRLPDSAVPSHVELNARLVWKVSEALSISLSGFNLLQPHHIEFIDPSVTPTVEIGRSFFVNAHLRV